MSIEHKLTALYKLRSEYKTLNTQKRELCERKKALETQIQEYLSQHGLPRCKTEDIIVTANTKTIRRRLNKTDKLENGIALLQKLGISNAKDVMDKLVESSKGESEKIESIHVKEL